MSICVFKMLENPCSNFDLLVLKFQLLFFNLITTIIENINIINMIKNTLKKLCIRVLLYSIFFYLGNII